MEYRRIRRSAAKLPQGNTVLPAAVIAFTFLSIVYVLGVSRLGGWLAETFVAPVFRVSETTGNADAPAQSEAAKPVAALKAEKLSVPALFLYTLQMGVFSSEENAAALAEQIQRIGAGGYVHNDAGRFRVLAAGYAKVESLQSVRAQLAAEGLESASYAVEVPAGVWRITADAETLAACQTAVSYFQTLAAELTDLALAFDKEEQSVQDGLRALSLLESELARQLQAYTDAADTSDKKCAEIASCFSEASAALAHLTEMDESGRAEFTAALKHAQLSVAMKAAALFRSLAA